MYLNIGQSVLIPSSSVIGIFDLDNTTWAYKTREFLKRAEREGRVVTVGDDLPRSFVLADSGDGSTTIYITTLSASALSARAERDSFE